MVIVRELQERDLSREDVVAVVWHKRENVVNLAKHEQAAWRQRLQRAYNRPNYDEALGALETLLGELDERNQSAAGSLAEGLDETLTLPRLGVYGVLGRSFKTTNCLESVNALVWNAAPQEERKPRGELEIADAIRRAWLDAGRVTLESKQELRTREQPSEPELDAGLEPAVGMSIVVAVEQHLEIALGHRPATGAPCQGREESAGRTAPRPRCRPGWAGTRGCADGWGSRRPAAHRSPRTDRRS